MGKRAGNYILPILMQQNQLTNGKSTISEKIYP